MATDPKMPMAAHCGPILWVLLLLGGCATAPPTAIPALPLPLTIHSLDIMPVGQWQADPEDVRRVLQAAAGELWGFFPGYSLDPIRVQRRSQGGPFVFFRRGPKGEYRVMLQTGQRYWAQYTYQFAHEFCHILCRYDEDPHPNRWFEESLCETASLFVLRRSAKTWTVNPPYPIWKDYAPALQKYAQERINAAPLPDGQSLGQWYRSNAQALAKTGDDRTRNNVVAVQLLPLFEASPEQWESVAYLNRQKLDSTYTFQKYLQAWHDQAPENRRAFIKSVAAKFDIRLK